MSAGVPEDFFSFLFFESDQLKKTVSFQWACQVDEFVFACLVVFVFGLGTGELIIEGGFISLDVLDFSNNADFGQIFGDALGDHVRGGKESLSLDLLSVFELR